MRVRRHTGQAEETEIDMTPMLDIVFIMLIFFIVTATFVKEAGIDVTKPDASTAQKRDQVGILVAISDSGDIWINKRKVDVRAVRANIERLLAENPKGGVVIQADKEAKVDLLVQVMDQANLAGAPSVAVAANEKGGG